MNGDGQCDENNGRGHKGRTGPSERDVTGEILGSPLIALWLAPDCTPPPIRTHTQVERGSEKKCSPRLVLPLARTDRRGLVR